LSTEEWRHKLQASNAQQLAALQASIADVNAKVSSLGREQDRLLKAIQENTKALTAILQQLRPILKISVFNEPTSGTLTPNLEATNSPATFRVYACFDSAGVLSIVRKALGKAAIVENLNNGTALVANAKFKEDFGVEKGQTIAIQYSVSCNCLYLLVLEVPSVLAV